jgi:hypothetical protein|nr:MAG TPA: hypothetical protein [Caudoviricetes sp.]
MSTNVGQINYVVNLDTTQALASIDKLQKEANNLRAILGKPFKMKAQVDNSAFQSLNKQAQEVGKQLQQSVSKPIQTKIKVDNSDLAYTQKMFDRFKMSAKSGGVFNPQVDNKRFLTGINAMENQVKAFKNRAEVPIQVQVNAKNLQSLNTELARVGKTMPELKNALANGISVNKFFSDAKMLQSESMRIQAQWSKMSSAISKGTENMINGFARFTKIVGKFTIGAGLIGFVKLMKEGFNGARNIQDSLEALDNANVFENYSAASKQLMKDWAELNKTTGKFDANGVLKEGARYASITQADYVEGAEKISLYLKDFKMSDQERVKAIKEFNALTADMSSFWNKDIDDLQDTLVRYMSGRAHSINMLVKGYDNFNIPQLNKMAEELFGKSFSKLDLASQKLVRVQYLFDSMGLTMDDNAKTMFTFNTAVRRLINNTKIISTGVWQLLLPTLSKVLDKLSWKFQGFAEKIGDLVADPDKLAQAGQQLESFIFGKVIPMVKIAGAIIGALMFGSTYLKMTGLTPAFSEQVPKLIKLAGKGGIDIGSKLTDAIGGGLSTLSKLMPGFLGPITSGLGAELGTISTSIAGITGGITTMGVGLVALPIIIATVGGAFQGLFQTIRELPTTMDQSLGEGTFGKLNESLQGVKQNTLSMFSGLWGILQQFFGGIWGVGQSIGGAIGKVFGAIMLGLGPILQFFTTIWNFVINFIEKTGIIQFFFDFVSSFISGLGETISSFLMPIFQAIGDVWRDNIQPAIQPLLDKLMEFAPKVKEFFDWLLEQWNTYIWPYVQQIAGFLGDTLAPIISTVGGWVGWAIGKVVDGVLWVWEKLEWLWGKLKPFFDKIKGAWDGLMEGIKGAFDTLIDGIKWLWNNTVVSWLNKAIEWANWIPGVDIGPVPEWHSSDFIVDDSDALQRHLDMANEINGRMARARNTLFSTQRDIMKTKANSITINIDNSNSVIPEQFANEIVNSTMTTLGGAYGLVR